jgi:hypothetical protein
MRPNNPVTGTITEVSGLLDDFIGTGKQRGGHGQT